MSMIAARTKHRLGRALDLGSIDGGLQKVARVVSMIASGMAAHTKVKIITDCACNETCFRVDYVCQFIIFPVKCFL